MGLHLKRSLQQLESSLLTIKEGRESPVDADGKAAGQSKGDMTEKVPKQRPEIQIQREHKTAHELEDSITQLTAKYDMETNFMIKPWFELRVEQLKRRLTLMKSSTEKLEAEVAV